MNISTRGTLPPMHPLRIFAGNNVRETNRSDGLQPNSHGLQPNSDGLQTTSDGLQSKSNASMLGLLQFSQTCEGQYPVWWKTLGPKCLQFPNLQEAIHVLRGDNALARCSSFHQQET